uniref:Uncharacterized protein n=1 Tax=Lactuca sativa TaxID=4236 RepID=A0A9R1W6T3_LACSA|nr:hypothetical protein LSAT_V11C300101460 [Lactuca sativa]
MRRSPGAPDGSEKKNFRLENAAHAKPVFFNKNPLYEFLNILCEEDDDDDATDDAQAQSNVELQIHNQELDSEYVQSSDEEELDVDFESSTHNPKVKWNLMKLVFGERYEKPQELNCV